MKRNFLKPAHDWEEERRNLWKTMKKHGETKQKNASGFKKTVLILCMVHVPTGGLKWFLSLTLNLAGIDFSWKHLYNFLLASGSGNVRSPHPHSHPLVRYKPQIALFILNQSQTKPRPDRKLPNKQVKIDHLLQRLNWLRGWRWNLQQVYFLLLWWSSLPHWS